MTTVHRSGGLTLKAWVNRPAADAGRVLLRDAGFVVMTPILRGEDGQPGHLSMFYDEVDDVLAAADHLAKLPYGDPGKVYVAGHSAGGTHAMLAAMASGRLRAAASLSGSPDRVAFVRSGYEAAVPFDQSDIREFRVRSPVAYATSFKCPARLYRGSEETYFDAETRRTALLARGRGLDVEAVVVPGGHMSCVPEALRRAIAFFRDK